jgi:hypothetical protein
MSDVEQVVNLPFPYVYGCALSTTTNTTCLVTTGFIRDDTNTIDMEVTAQLTINGAEIGANGLDIGELDTDEWYAVFIIGDKYKFNPPAALISLSLTDPVMPNGYSVKRRIGWLKTDGSSHFIAMAHDGVGNERRYSWVNSEAADIIVLSGGTETSFTNIDCSALIPPTARNAVFNFEYEPKLAENKFYIRLDGTAVTTNFVYYGNVAEKIGSGQFQYPVSTNTRIIEYHVTTDDALSLFILGFIDYI